jgi:hypothetical protein
VLALVVDGAAALVGLTVSADGTTDVVDIRREPSPL